MIISTCNSCKFKNLSLTNLRLYHYAGNNPVRYVDPDGKSVVFDSYFESLISDMYKRSRSFRYYFSNLLLQKNIFNENLFVYIRIKTISNDTSTAIMQTENLTLPEKTTFFAMDDYGNIVKVDIPEGVLGQVIIIDIDYDKFKTRNRVFIIAEEVFHAWESRLMGAEKWNELSRIENEKYDYNSRPRERRAKDAAKIIEEEYHK